MKYILDSTIAARWYVPEPNMAKALRLRLDFRLGIHQLLAPDHMPIECGELLLRAERKGVLNPSDTDSYLQNLALLNIPLHATSSLLRRAAAMAFQTRLSLADGLYLALAEQENCPLLTDDPNLLKNSQSHFSFVVSFDILP